MWKSGYTEKTLFPSIFMKCSLIPGSYIPSAISTLVVHDPEIGV